MYVLLSGMLPFDSEDNKETARQTIYDPVPFDHPVWKYASDEAKDLILSKKHTMNLTHFQDYLRRIDSREQAQRKFLATHGFAEETKIYKN